MHHFVARLDLGQENAGKSGDAENYKTLNNRARTAENWRNSKFAVWCDFGWGGTEYGIFDYPYDTAAEGVSKCYGGANPPFLPTIYIKSSTSTEKITISKPLRIEACGGPARIGG